MEKFRFAIAGIAMAAGCATSAIAEIEVVDAYARASNTKAGAAFMMIKNTGTEADRLISVASDVAVRVELHTHKDLGDGVMKMMHVEDGFEIPAGGTHMLSRGGDHVMFMGLKAPFEQGESVSVTMEFEKAGEITVDIPIDHKRKQKHGKSHDH